VVALITMFLAYVEPQWCRSDGGPSALSARFRQGACGRSVLRIGKDPTKHGGWVDASPGIKAILGYVETDRSLVESLVRPRAPARGQTWSGSAVGRKAIESYAMGLAKSHYESSGGKCAMSLLPSPSICSARGWS